MDSLSSKQGYEVTYILPIKIFHRTSSEAILQAEIIANSIRTNKYAIPILNKDGTITEEELIFNKIDCSIVDDRVATINLEWDKKYQYKQ